MLLMYTASSVSENPSQRRLVSEMLAVKWRIFYIHGNLHLHYLASDKMATRNSIQILLFFKFRHGFGSSRLFICLWFS
jgi:hypothetical protein